MLTFENGVPGAASEDPDGQAEPPTHGPGAGEPATQPAVAGRSSVMS